MSTTEKAGNLLPQNCPELEQFIKAQAHIRAAARIIDILSVHKLPHLPKEQADSFRNLASETRDTLWDEDSHVQDLATAFYLPLYPIEPLNPQDHAKD